MAVTRKTLNLLPTVFQTDTNQKFLSATMDQLVSEPNLTTLYGYVGRKFAPTYQDGDSYVIEDSAARQNYQLEPSIVVKNDQQNVTFFSSYVDFLNKINYYGGFTNNQSRLFDNEYYSFDPLISYDKFVNFSQYYWLPNGPAPVSISTSGTPLTATFNVYRNASNGDYVYTSNGQPVHALTLARGGVYKFVVDQPGYPFWIQTELGTNGTLAATPTISSRTVLGVDNNGTDSGTVTFLVPQSTAQDRFTAMTTVASIDYATPIPYYLFQNKTQSQFEAEYPQYVGIVGDINSKQLVFLDQDLSDSTWTTPVVHDNNGNVVPGYNAGTIVPNSERYGIWQVLTVDAGITKPDGSPDLLITLFYVRDVVVNQKVYIKYGVANANKEFYKDYDGFFHQTPLLSSLLDTLYVQDQYNANLNNAIKIVEYSGWVIDVENDILGQQNYTSPNGVDFTTGLKIEFGTDVTPASYQNNQYYVEEVGSLGTGIRLIPVSELVTPEAYNTENATLYPTNKIVLDTATNDVIPAGTTITIGSTAIVTDTSISKGSLYITTLTSIADITYGMLVSGTGIASGTLVNDAYLATVFPDYITINRSSLDRNAWSRNNRWFHGQVITDTAKYRGEVVSFDQNLRAKRPIIQFDADIQLFNAGRIGKVPVDILDTTTVDAFTQLDGQILNFAFGVPLFNGMRVIFAADKDPLVINKIYVINLVQYTVDNAGAPSGPKYIKLDVASDGVGQPYDTVVVTKGQYAGSQWWYDGVQWNASQQKTALQQEPLFDVYNSSIDLVNGLIVNGASLSTLDRSTFAGTKLFGYLKNASATPDPVLGFGLTYRSLGTQGDIEFQNYFNSDTFTYAVDNVVGTYDISIGFLQKIVDRYTLAPKNTWQRVAEFSKQYQLIGYIYDGTSSVFPIDVTPNDAATIPYIKVFKNFNYLTDSQWILVSGQVRLTDSQVFIGDGTTTQFILTNVNSTTNGVIVLINNIPRQSAGLYSVVGTTITFVTAPVVGTVIDIRVITTLTLGDKIDILVYSSEQSKLGYYEIPLNLDLNAQNADINTLTLGQIRNHLVALGQNTTQLIGNILSSNNLRDIDIKQQGGIILQHAAPVPYGELFLTDDQANLIDSLRLATKEYTKFKNKFLELSVSLNGINPTDPIKSVDLILANINALKNTTFPWYYSDMVPYGTQKTTLSYTVFDINQTDYEINAVFNSNQLSNRAVLVYVNGNQLVKDLNFTFLTDRPAVRFIDTLNLGDSISIVDYANTDGNYIPETPSKLGLWPKSIPELFYDNSYRTPITVVRGHDGSITPGFGDYRDSFLLELELRIYNNIKLPDTGTYGDILSVIPGAFRPTDYSLAEIDQLVAPSFLSWIGNNSLDFTINNTFDSNDPFTWNYSSFTDKITGNRLQGSWRACYQYFYDTFTPHLTPWEMLGFTTMPVWWQEEYGPGPYTSGNKLLWQDLEAGLIRNGTRAGIDPHYARPGLSQIIPADANGNLLSPAAVLTVVPNPYRAADAWAIGQYGPVEFAWRSSSEFPYAVQRAIALAKPARYFGQQIDTYNYTNLNALYDLAIDAGQYLIRGNNHHIRQTDINYNGQTVDGMIYRGAGYLNYIADYLTSLGVNPSNKITTLLQNYQVNLAYKAAGFTDQNYLNVLAEQNSPSSTNDTIVIPNENYKVYLNKSTPTQTLNYSAVIVEKQANGYSVRGYDINNPYFTIIPSIVDGNATQLSVLNSTATVFNNYQKVKLTVPYGYEFSNPQQIVDFLISYERYLLSQGFTFNDTDPNLGEQRDWKLSAKEFLYWEQQGWQTGTILVLSPVANVLNAVSVGAITDGISDSQYGSRVIDQNFKLIKNVDYDVLRSANTFKVTITNSASMIGFVEVDLVQYEHVLIFDNTTVFNDVIYQPDSGNRQFRLKLIGQKTADWDGSLYAPGFIYWAGQIDEWSAGNDYLQGDLVQYKNQYYTALQDVIASTTFQFQYWQQLNKSQIQTGLLPNFSMLAAEGKAYYNDYPSIDSKKQVEFSHGLIGYRPRQYLSDLGLSDTTQIEFYKGYIAQKGSLNAVTQMTSATFNNLSSNISLYEEWAMRVGEYGAISSNPYVEVPLSESAFGANPSMAEFVDIANSNLADGITIFNQQQLYKSEGIYTGNIALNRTIHSNYDNDIPTAGYVNLNDIDATLFDISNYSSLNSQIDIIGSGYRIWVAKDQKQNWNVFRVSETNNFISNVTVASTGYVTFNSTLPHGLAVGDVFLVKGLSTTFDGFHQVHAVIDNNHVTVPFTGDTTALPLAGKGPLFVLYTLRFKYMEDARIFGLSQPIGGWKVGEKIWVDVTAATTLSEGVPYVTPNNVWNVYEKAHPWNSTQQLLKGSGEYTTGDGFGTSVSMSADNSAVAVGSPYAATTGTVQIFLKNYQNEFNEGFTILPLTTNTVSFGSAVSLAADSNNNSILAVGAPQSYGNVGYVMLYSKAPGFNSYTATQVIVGNTVSATSETFGSTLVLNTDAHWLYVGAPANDRAYTYGLNSRVPYKQQITSVNNTNYIRLTGNVTVNVGDILTEPVSGASVKVLAAGTNISNVKVSSLTNIITNGILANIVLSGNITANIGDSITQTSSNSSAIVYGAVQNSNQVYGLYSTGPFDTTGNIAINGNVQVVHPTYVGSGNIFLNGNDTKLYANVTYTSATTNSIALNFVPYVANDASSLFITSGAKTFLPGLDYTLSGNTVNFISGNLSPSTITITQQPYYAKVGDPLHGNVGSKFGTTLSTSADGAQLAVGAPADTVVGLKSAGSIFVYDRVIEAFKSTGNTDYITKNPIGSVYRVTIDGVEVPTTDYVLIGTNTIRFAPPPPVGHVIYIEVNLINLLEQLIGVDSLENTLTALQANAAFGTSVTVCSINCAIYTGAPYYNNGTEYSSGAVWKFHNRGRLYGTNTGYKVNPVFTPGDSIRLNNFEIVVSGRMMPTTVNGAAANILALSSNVSATVGQYITQASSGANVRVLANVTNGQFITVSNYLNANTWNYGQSIAGANLISIGGTVSSAHPMASLDSIVKDVNDAKILGVTAVNQGGLLRLNSDVTIVKDQLRILSGIRTPGSSGVYADADLRLFAFMQIIVNPFGSADEYFGNTVKIAPNAYMLIIGSSRGTTHTFTSFDKKTTTNGTTFDADSTRFVATLAGSGSVYIYELYDDPRNDVYTPGRYQYCQQLDPGGLSSGDRFGYASDIQGTYAVTTAPGTTVTGEPAKSGTVYIFHNPTLARGWGLIHSQEDLIDVDSLSRAYLYSNQSNTILINLQFIDPAKGRILGEAEQEISYKTEYDPAVYNHGTNASADINSSYYWGSQQVGQVWWNLSKVRYILYEQDTLSYRSINWGSTFPGSTIEVCEWVESTVLPSQYTGDGQPKYADNSAYVQITYVDAVTGIISSKYYFWVINKNTVDPNNPTRLLPITTIADYIQNPKNQGIAYAAVIQQNAVILYNISQYLSADNTILHLDYQLVINTNIIHSEYELVQKGNADVEVPPKLVDKLIDSLAGIDSFGSVVPDPALTTAASYGISIRPRQSMFIDRLTAVTELVAYVNVILAANPIAKQFDLTQMNSQDPIPNVNSGAYDQSVAVDADLNYIDTSALATGYKVLVINDTTQDGLWVIYQLTADKTWDIYQVQSYKSSLYWHYTDWYADGYSASTQITFTVETTNDAIALKPVAGDIIFITNATGNGTWQLVLVNTNGIFEVIGIQNGTIQLDTSLGDFANNSLGFGNQGFSTGRYDQNPNIETRYIIQALRDNIFINTLNGQFNNLFFVMVNYIFNEQKYVDWIFKSSFISIKHKLRTLAQFPSYIQDNQTYYQSYIEEVKPYRTQIREYSIDYTGNDTFDGDVTDFDLPAYYDTSTSYNIFRSPSGEAPYTAEDEATWQTYPYNQWYNNRKLQLDSILVENPGLGYTSIPEITITGGGGSGATAIAEINGNTGALIGITVTNSGSGYTYTPTVTINGSANVAATAYAVIKNHQVRNFDTTIKFDRTTYKSTVLQWQANTAYTVGQIVTYAQQEGNAMIRRAYQVNANTVTPAMSFIASNYTLYAANLFTNASDRIVGYYQPAENMPVVDVISVPLTVANAAVNTNKIYVFPVDFIIPGMSISDNGVTAGLISNVISNVSITISNVVVSVTQLTLSVNVSLATDTTITGTYNSLDQLIAGVTYPSLPTVGADFKLNPLFGETFDNVPYDGIEYSQDGIPLLSTAVVDTILQSNYTDESLGITPGDITTDGGQYLDPYHSHAPEELVPGIVFDTLDMRIYTSNVMINSVSSTVAYRIFDNMINQPSYLRIADAYTTTLTANLYLTDSNVHVANASILPTPSIILNTPGVVFINNERITYWTANTITNTLGQIRRGTQGTAVPNVQVIGSKVIDASPRQIIPGTSFGNLLANVDVFYNPGPNIATDGTGINGSNAQGALFLKASPATVS